MYDDRDLLSRLRRRPTESQVAAPPTHTTSPTVLFLTRLWHTGTGDPHREAITDSRIRLVRLLRQELGEAFIGGLRADEFSLANCRDLVVPHRLTDKANYLRLMQTTPDDCVHQVVRLMKDKERREAMMVHNQTYYRSHLQPEMLVLDALRQCV